MLKVGSACSSALTLLNTTVTLDNIEHLSSVEALDMQLFEAAMRDASVNAGSITAPDSKAPMVCPGCCAD